MNENWSVLDNATVVHETAIALCINVYARGRSDTGEAFEGWQKVWFPKAVCFQKENGISVPSDLLAQKEEEIAERGSLSICGIDVVESSSEDDS